MTSCEEMLRQALSDTLAWLVDAENETGKPLGGGLGYRAKMQKPVIIEKIQDALNATIPQE